MRLAHLFVSAGVCIIASAVVFSENHHVKALGQQSDSSPQRAKNGVGRRESADPLSADQESGGDERSADEWHRLYSERIKQPVELGAIPKIIVNRRVHPSQPDFGRIKSLISRLSETDNFDIGYSPSTSGYAFSPVSAQSRGHTFLVAEQKLRQSEALKELVECGADAMPLLLESLENQTPTKISLRHTSLEGGMWFAEEMSGNPLNPLESKVYARQIELLARDRKPEEQVNEFRLRVGDLCFVAIGQIVGRSYQAVRYQPTACTVINSPTHNPTLAASVRAIWKSDRPREVLLQSLLLDYSSIGRYHPGDSLDVWSVGSDLQVSATVRLLYYFPNESGDLIAERLRRLNVEKAGPGDFSQREVRNAVSTEQFIHATAWSRLPAIRTALTEIFSKSTDLELLLAALPAVNDSEGTMIPRRFRTFLEKEPLETESIYSSGYRILLAWTKVAPDTSKDALEEYIKSGSLTRLQTACVVLSECSPSWKISFLRKFLDDSRSIENPFTSPATNEDGEIEMIRLCDWAAAVISTDKYPISFSVESTVENRDRQIVRIRNRIDQQCVVH